MGVGCDFTYIVPVENVMVELRLEEGKRVTQVTEGRGFLIEVIACAEALRTHAWLPYKFIVRVKKTQGHRNPCGRTGDALPISFFKEGLAAHGGEWLAGRLQLCTLFSYGESVRDPVMGSLPGWLRSYWEKDLSSLSPILLPSFPFTGFDLPGNPICDSIKLSLLWIITTWISSKNP